MWVYGSGFPKSHNISKAIDKKFGRKYEAIPAKGVGFINSDKENWNACHNQLIPISEQTEQAKAWDGWGTALKPAYEPIILVRKPPVGSIAQNVLDHGCGGINIDATRIQYGGDENINFNAQQRQQANCEDKGWSGHVAQVGTEIQMFKEKGRFPANVMIDEHIDHEAMNRYFYCTKASKKEREAGLSHIDSKRANTHPTVKPLDLMRYLVKMVVPPSGTALDPFCGSGSTLCALALENMNGIGIELQEEYCEIAQARVKHWGGEAERVSPPKKELEELPLFKGLL
jgi:site-specific DNA-methyltransferase (adenine-specific)